MKLYFLALATVVVVVFFLLWMLRTRRLKEKYAAIWLILSVSVAIIGAFPASLISIASFVGVVTPTNLLFASALAVLFGVCIQLSAELSSNEEETRTLTEEIALLRLDLDRMRDALPMPTGESPDVVSPLALAAEDSAPELGNAN